MSSEPNGDAVGSTGRLVIMGSGETAPSLTATHRAALEAARTEELVVLDSPFGFQENATELTERLETHFNDAIGAKVSVASLRATDVDPVEAARARTILTTARAVFAGPGSPSYALSVWRSHGVGDLLGQVIGRGGAVILSSAAALTAGSHTLPVYEIYKVGERPHWLEGLNLISRFGLRAVVIPHWNNAEGGTHDTSRCYVGQRRLGMLERELDCGIVGVDEHTAAIFDGRTGTLSVEGKGTVTLRGATDRVLGSGEQVGLGEVAAAVGTSPPQSGPATPLAPIRREFTGSLTDGDVDGVVAAMLDVEERVNSDPDLRGELRSMIVQLAEAARQGLVDPRDVVGGFVELLLELRRDARQARRYEDADRIRDGLASLGVEVRDTESGDEWLLEED